MAAQIKKPRKPRKIDAVKVEQLREKGLTIYDIAKHQDVTPSAIYKHLVDYSGRKERLEEAKNNMAGLLMQSCADNMAIAHLIKQDVLLNWEKYKNETDLRLKKEWLIAVEGGRHYNYLDYRLETDQSTENQAVLVSAIHELKSRKRLRNGEEVAVINREEGETGDCAL